jgi:hypothetical protein
MCDLMGVMDEWESLPIDIHCVEPPPYACESADLQCRHWSAEYGASNVSLPPHVMLADIFSTYQNTSFLYHILIGNNHRAMAI